MCLFRMKMSYFVNPGTKQGKFGQQYADEFDCECGIDGINSFKKHFCSFF